VRGQMANDRESPAPHQTVHAVFQHTAFTFQVTGSLWHMS
jgi:hypothetical protein